MAILDIIQKLEEVSLGSRQDAEQVILDLWISGERNFFTSAQLALNFDIDYQLASVPRISEDDDANFIPTFTWSHFHALTKKLRSSKYDAGQRKAMVIAAAETADAKEWNQFYRHILLQTFPWVKVKTINKILRKLSLSDKSTLDYLVCEFSYQESHHENATNNLKNLRGVKTVSSGHTGHIGMLVINIEDRTSFIYHGSKNNLNSQHDIGDLYETLPCSMVIECRTDTIQSPNNIHLIDCFPLQDYYRGECLMPYKDRQAILTGVLGVMLKLTNQKFKLVQKITVDFSTEQGRANVDEFIQQLRDDGVSYIYVKDPEAPYQVGKSKNKNSIMLETSHKSNG